MISEPWCRINPPFWEKGGGGGTPFGVNLSGMVKGSRPSPGAWGRAPTFSSPPCRLRRRGKKGKRVFRVPNYLSPGQDSPKPRQGGGEPPCTLRSKQHTFQLTPLRTPLLY